MKGDSPGTIFLRDYAPPPFTIERVDLRFELGEESTTVHARLEVVRNGHHRQPLVLLGDRLELRSVSLDGQLLSQHEFRRDDSSLAIATVPERFVLEIETALRPQDNTALEGLYQSSGNFCTQCEAEGFRRITYFLDRPDVMARYTTTIVADRLRYPVLLSNGNVVARGELDGGQHWVQWEDPFRKPSYLFALVAGDLAHIEDRFTTVSGREVTLRIYAEHENIAQCGHAMASLKQAMAWDEQRFGLEYDLDIYMIVAVGDFNMGAMENKGLNVFNSKYVLARPESATDGDFDNIQNVIGHEYFHNWTGNRITCRDWFQLSLKEGLTVFRDQEFSADMGSRPLRRIQDVRGLRASQFPEDAGPMAHPVRPDSYVEINNFYTATVYEKGAEVVRMYQTLLGVDGFRKGMDLYIKRHDGQAVTTEDFRAAMADANGVDLEQFGLWYSQAGTPVVEVEGEYDAAAAAYTLRVRQHCPATPGQDRKQPFHIPLAIGLVGPDGEDLPLQLEGEAQAIDGTRVLQITSAEQRFRFVNVQHEPRPSLLRSFSAPVKLRYRHSDQNLAFLMAHDTDLFNRWEAGQQLACRVALDNIESWPEPATAVPKVFVDAFERLLTPPVEDKALLAESLLLPSERYLGEQLEIVDPQAIHHTREWMRSGLAGALRAQWLACYRDNVDREGYRFDPQAVGRRSLKNACLGYLMQLGDDEAIEICLRQFEEADNMTDSMAALRALLDIERPERAAALERFYERWQHEPLVVDKWFALQAVSKLPDTLDRVRALLDHPAFTLRNPNRVRALLGTFCSANLARFHAAGGEGYEFLAEQILRLDSLNPQVAARLLGALSRWRKYEPARGEKMRAALDGVSRHPGLSKDCYEIAHKSLA